MKIRAPQDFAAGLFMVAIAVIALWQGAGLAAGTMGHMGPGMLPRALSVIALLLGAALVADGFLEKGAPLERWHLRGPLFILGAAVLFGLTIRPAGLAVAGPLAVIVGAQADPGTRPVEAAVFALVLTAFCIGLFKLALGLPIPLAPWLLGY
jgi:putative tricarboxylic transport membrane protein